MKIGIVLGTRPEIIKMSPIIDEIRKNNTEYVLIHTGQHYDTEMSNQFFIDLELPLPKYNIQTGSNTAISQVSIILSKLEEILIKEDVDIVLIQGDTNAVLAGALTANKLGVPVGHVEAGLRSFDKDMPEEINRLVADNCSLLYFVPTDETAINLENEGVNHNSIYVTGNSIVDACQRNVPIAQDKCDIEKDLEFKEFVSLTLHRAENVDNKSRLNDIVETLINLPCNIVFPLHPHTRNSLKKYDLYEKISTAGNIQITKPLGYLDFLHLLSKSKLVITDSGGVQEEAITLDIPCVTLRYNTERPETIHAGGNILAGSNKDEITGTINKILDNDKLYEKMSRAENPYGDGQTARRIYSIIKQRYDEGSLNIRSQSDIMDFEGYYLENIKEHITVEELERQKKGCIVQQVFSKNVAIHTSKTLDLYNKTIILKKFRIKR